MDLLKYLLRRAKAFGAIRIIFVGHTIENDKRQDEWLIEHESNVANKRVAGGTARTLEKELDKKANPPRY